MKKDYIAFNNFILSDENLTLEEGYMLQVLFQYHNIECGYAYPTYTTLMKACKTNRQAKISKILKSLVAKGYIIIENHGNNRYYIVGVESYARSRAKNLFAYVYRLLKDNVVLGAKDTSTNPHYNSATPKGYSSFNNFEGRNYTQEDYDELEKQLLGWT